MNSTSYWIEMSNAVSAVYIYVFRVILSVNSDYFLKQPLTG
jgi:hypothetical protein